MIRQLACSDCYLLFIFFRNILKIITILLVYVNISRIFTSELKQTNNKASKNKGKLIISE